jgi:hypothetical protein
VVAGDDGHARFLHQRLGGVLQSHSADRGGRGADECEASGRDGLDEVGVLGKEAIAWVDGLGAGAAAGFDDVVDCHITLRSRRRPDVNGFIGFGDMEGVPVRVGIDSDGRDAEAACGADDTTGDFTAISDQDFLEHAIRWVDWRPGATS